MSHLQFGLQLGSRLTPQHLVDHRPRPGEGTSALVAELLERTAREDYQHWPSTALAAGGCMRPCGHREPAPNGPGAAGGPKGRPARPFSRFSYPPRGECSRLAACVLRPMREGARSRAPSAYGSSPTLLVAPSRQA